MAKHDITINISNPAISCSPKGGHAHGRPQDQFHWKGNAPFTLAFADFDTSVAKWPFAEPRPDWPVADTGVLTILNTTGNPMYIKYTVKADHCNDLDPIIIVDR